VAVVVGDEVVLAKGYGFRDVEKKLPMTPETQMPIASMTKQFTVARSGRWSGRASSIGTSRCANTCRISAEQRIRHRQCDDARSGHASHRVAAARFRLVRLRSLARTDLSSPPVSSLQPGSAGEVQYNNLMYMTSGYLAGQLAKSSWEELVKTRSSRRSA
jgi:CubicO group peptidase (beta-lactamase class C family)